MNIQIRGKVVKGKQFGRVLGFPTINLDRRDYSRRKIEVKLGIWSGAVSIINHQSQIINHPSAIVIGPLDASGLPKLEAHLIGFKGNLYGKTAVITLESYIRPFRHYPTLDLLKKQINKDLLIVKGNKK